MRRVLSKFDGHRSAVRQGAQSVQEVSNEKVMGAAAEVYKAVESEVDTEEMSDEEVKEVVEQKVDSLAFEAKFRVAGGSGAKAIGSLIVLLVVAAFAGPLDSVIQQFNLTDIGFGGSFIADQAVNLVLLAAGISTVVNAMVAIDIKGLRKSMGMD
jgi:hypothetical protein